MDHDRAAMKVASLLLQYPDERLRDTVGEMLDFPDGAVSIDFQKGCRELLELLKNGTLVRIQESYTHTFDLSADTSLHLSYHKWGEGKERGEALLRLKQSYREAGYEIFHSELPDYLPLVLEFFSIASEEFIQAIWNDYGSQVESIACALERKHSPYARLVRSLCLILESRVGGGHRYSFVTEGHP